MSVPLSFPLPSIYTTNKPDLSYFEDDDAKLAEIETSYRNGSLLTGDLKKMAIAMLQEYVKEFQDRRKGVTDEVMRAYMTPREMEWKGNPNPVKKEKKEKKGKVEKAVPAEAKPVEKKSES